MKVIMRIKLRVYLPKHRNIKRASSKWKCFFNYYEINLVLIFSKQEAKEEAKGAKKKKKSEKKMKKEWDEI